MAQPCGANVGPDFKRTAAAANHCKATMRPHACKPSSTVTAGNHRDGQPTFQAPTPGVEHSVELPCLSLRKRHLDACKLRCLRARLRSLNARFATKAPCHEQAPISRRWNLANTPHTAVISVPPPLESPSTRQFMAAYPAVIRQNYRAECAEGNSIMLKAHSHGGKWRADPAALLNTADSTQAGHKLDQTNTHSWLTVIGQCHPVSANGVQHPAHYAHSPEASPCKYG